MKYNKKENLTDSFAIFLSLAIHGLLCLGAYYLPIYRGSKGSVTPYKIELDLQTFHEAIATSNQESTVQEEEEMPPVKPSEPVTEQTTAEDVTVIESPKEDIQNAASEEIKQEANTIEDEPKQEQPAIDERGIYKPSEGKKTGASLEIVGWIWDSVPHPQDNTDEVGKIVFEVTIDDSGEIIAITTLEKTVSPLVEQLYKDEVAKLSFSKTNKNMNYAPTSTGRITFILQYK